MKSTLKFDLSDPEQSREHLRAIKADKAYRVLYELSVAFRNELKYNESLQESQSKIVEQMQSKFYELMEENSINLDEEYL